MTATETKVNRTLRKRRRSLILPIAWLLIATVATAALVKLAFFPDREQDADLAATGQLEAPITTVERGSVINAFELQGSVQADPGVPIRATDSGVVTYVYVKEGDQIRKGEPVIEVREEIGQTEPQPISEGDLETSTPPEYSQPEPIYAYHTINSPASGTVTGFTALLKQSVGVGEELGQVGPGTFTVVSSLTAAQQYRMLDQPSSATVTVPGGPAPFTCTSLEVGSADPNAKPAPQQPVDPYGYDPYGQAQSPADTTVTGQIRCAVPSDQRVFTGLTATVSVVAGEATDVLTLPVTAVKGDYATGTVYVVGAAGGEPTEVQIELGLTDGVIVEVKSGLDEGDTVLEYVPSEVPMNDGQGFYGVTDYVGP